MMQTHRGRPLPPTPLPPIANGGSGDWKSMLRLFWMALSTCPRSVFYSPIRRDTACCVIREEQIDYVYEDVHNVPLLLVIYFLQGCHIERDLPGYVNKIKTLGYSIWSCVGMIT